MRKAVLSALGALLFLACGCGGAALTERDPSVGVKTAAAVDWNPSHVEVGHVAAVVELGDEVHVFSDAGVFVFVGGSLAGSSSAVKRWAGASTVEASDGHATWVVGVDADGNLWRVRDRSRLERIGDRFALPSRPVLSAFGASSGARHFSVFLLDDRLAVADGTQVRFVPAHARGAAGSGTVVALREDKRVTKLSTDLRSASAYPLSGTSLIAVDGHERVFAARDDGVFAEDGGRLVLVYRASRGKVHGLAASGERVWFAEAGRLAALDGTGPSRRVARVEAPPVADDARLFGSASGDVWVVDRGRLSRFSLPGERSYSSASGIGHSNEHKDDGDWDKTVRPIFLRVCASCHAPGGSSGVDLSSAGAWRSSRAEIRERVVTARSMPPAGAPHPLTDADRSALAHWLGN
jgi:hypothetical protein